ncbi:MAG: hypothetical protein NC834_06440 [Candidatus Omnitrophica bacterium]|nr:hypothetical protein [Candidatus Omnitrophota bacterium]
MLVEGAKASWETQRSLFVFSRELRIEKIRSVDGLELYKKVEDKNFN